MVSSRNLLTVCLMSVAATAFAGTATSAAADSNTADAGSGSSQATGLLGGLLNRTDDSSGAAAPDSPQNSANGVADTDTNATGDSTDNASANNSASDNAGNPNAPKSTLTKEQEQQFFSEAAPPKPASFEGRVYNCEGDECKLGKFSQPRAEPTIRYSDSTTGKMQKAVTTDKKCIKDADGLARCKPASVSLALLPNNHLVYFNGLEGTENVELSIVDEYGEVSTDDETRDLSLGGPGPQDQFSWRRPSPVSGGANIDQEYPSDTLLPGAKLTDAENKDLANQGALFCADLAQLYNGNIIAVGGTDYYTEPSVDSVFPQARNVLKGFQKQVNKIEGDKKILGSKLPGVPEDIGVAELEGLRNARIFDYKTDRWHQTGDLTYGRWYPTVVTLPNGNVFIASGVTKLLKPVYLGGLNKGASPNKLLDSGRNVTYTETYDVDTGKWSVNHAKGDRGSAQRSLPLFPRMDLLPNGDIFYAGGGQSFNPFGQAYDQALWNIVGAYDPRSQSWTDLGYAGLPLTLSKVGANRLTSALNPTSKNKVKDLVGSVTDITKSLLTKPVQSVQQVQQLSKGALSPSKVNQILGSGFRGSTFGIMLPLRPNEQGDYRKVHILTAGGVLGAVAAGSPGTYQGQTLSRIDTVTIDDPSDPINGMSYSSTETPNMTGGARWYPSGVLLPDDSVVAFNGANRDDVLLPGLSNPKQETERFSLADPKDVSTGTWEPMAKSIHPRTYHNIAILLPDGRVLVGGHAPISTAYLYNADLSKLGFSPDDGRDPSFEVYSPPYMFAKNRPTITDAPSKVGHGDTFTVKTPDADAVNEVLLIRRTATTHLVDGDQRSVVLPITERGSGALTVKLSDNPAVTPPGYYMLFINKKASDGSGNLIPSTSREVRVKRDAVAKNYLANSDSVAAGSGDDSADNGAGSDSNDGGAADSGTTGNNGPGGSLLGSLTGGNGNSDSGAASANSGS